MKISLKQVYKHIMETSLNNSDNIDLAKQLASIYLRLHNEASKQYKEAFKSVGARLWHDDDAHLLKPENGNYIANNFLDYLDRDIPIHFPLPRPLTVLDSYPNVTREQKQQLDLKVDDIYNHHVDEYHKAIRNLGAESLFAKETFRRIE